MSHSHLSTSRRFGSMVLCTGLAIFTLTSSRIQAQSIVDQLDAILPIQVVATTVPTVSGDQNPYGVAFVPAGFHSNVLNPGDVLVSNFNNGNNQQGLGGSIVRITPAGKTSLFFQGGALGLTGALGILQSGFILVGSLPTLDGTSNTVQQGALLVLNANGTLVATLTDATFLNGPWGLAINDSPTGQAQVFISNVTTGTVVRLDIAAGKMLKMTQIASGYPHRLDPAAIVLGPSGLAYDARLDTLYVASEAEDAVFAIRGAKGLTSDNGTGTMIYQDNVHLHGPLDLVLAPNGHLITANADGFNADPNQPSELVEFTTGGQFVRQLSVDKNNGGAFGLAVERTNDGIKIAAVDDNAASLTIFTVKNLFSRLF